MAIRCSTSTVGAGIHALQPAGGQQALHDTNVLGAEFTPAK
jgi:hypothetical protein